MRIQTFLLSVAAMIVVGGCTTARVGTEPGAAQLPAGVTLLDSDRGRCNGTVEIRREAVRGAGSSDLVVREGENATFEAADDDIQWMCLNGLAVQRQRMECPERTTYVRVTRGATADDFLIECYGS